MTENRGGRREGAGRKRLGRKAVNLSLTQKAFDNICRVAKERGMTRSDLVIEWAEALSTYPHQGFLVEKTR